VFVSFTLIIFHPEDVVGGVEGYKHNARRLGLARELVFRFAGHHGKAPWTKSAGRHAFHLCLDASLSDDELFCRSVVMPGHETIWWSFQDDGGWSLGGIASFDCGGETLYVIIGFEFDFGEGPKDTVLRDLSLEQGRRRDEQNRQPNYAEANMPRRRYVPSSGDGLGEQVRK